MSCSSCGHYNRAGRKLCQPRGVIIRSIRKDDLDTDYVPIGDLTKSGLEARELAIAEEIARRALVKS